MLQGKLSVIIPVYNELHIKDSIQRLIDVLVKAQIPYEIIIVDDGSDGSVWNDILALKKEYSEIIAILLSRNFGKEQALCAGLDVVSGDCCVCIDADLQHPPEIIPQMYSLWRDYGYEVVEGVKKRRCKESFFYKFCASYFYKILYRLANLDLKNSSDFRLLDRVALNAWREMPERQTFFRGMSSWIGFSRTQVYFDVSPRENGTSKWSISKLLKLAIYAITSYSAVPLYGSVFFGFFFLLFFIGMFVQTLYMKLGGYAQNGFTTVIILQLIIGSILMISVGIIGVYIEKIYNEVKGRPRYVIRKILKNEEIDD